MNSSSHSGCENPYPASRLRLWQGGAGGAFAFRGVIAVCFMVLPLFVLIPDAAADKNARDTAKNVETRQYDERTGEPIYNWAFSPEDHIEELLDAYDERFQGAGRDQPNSYEWGRLDKASKVYAKELDYFTKNAIGVSDTLSRLSETLVEAFKPATAQQLAGLSSPLSIDTHQDWDRVKAVIEKSRELVHKMHTHKILTTADFGWPGLDELAAKLGEVESYFLTNATAALASYPLFDAPDFFESYPVPLGPTSTAADSEEIWLSAISTATRPQLEFLATTYSGQFPEDVAARLSDEYYLRVLHQDGTLAEPSLQAILRAATATADLGLSLEEIPGVKVGLVEVTSRTLTSLGQIEFPLAVDLDLPVEAEATDLDAGFSGPISETADILIILDIVAAQTERDISTRETVLSEYQSGTERIPNPDYPMARAEVDRAAMNLQQSQITSGNQQSSGTILDVIAAIVNMATVSSARDEYDEAITKLGQTPMMKEVPIYSEYDFHKVSIDVAKEGTVHYYIVDRRAETYLRGTFDLRQTRHFTVAYGIHPNDRRRASYLAETDSEEDVLDFEEEPVNVKLSSILKQFDAQASRVQEFTGLEDLRRMIVAEKNEALSVYAESQFGIDDVDDSRFDSVVVVYNPAGSMGTGFFVRDDIVVTNFHVVDGVNFVEMWMYNGQETFGKVIATDVRLDLALVKVQARGQPVTIYTDRTMPIGATVEVIGHPTGYEFSITRGVVSAVRKLESRKVPGGKPVMFIQTDAAINPGNSGGPLFLGNQVVGVNTWKVAMTVVEGMNFSIHYSEILTFLDKHDIAYKTRDRGIEEQEADAEIDD